MKLLNLLYNQHFVPALLKFILRFENFNTMVFLKILDNI